MVNDRMIHKSKFKWGQLKQQLPFHILLIPALIYVIIFQYIPLYGVIIAFEKYNPKTLFASPWVGLDNFIYIFNLPGFLRTIRNTVFIAVLKIIGNLAVPIIFSLMLNEIRTSLLKRTAQTFVYLPHFVSWVIMAGIIQDIFDRSGIINNLIISMNGTSVDFLGDTKWFPRVIVITDVWKNFGFNTIVYMAALTGIDPTLYEASAIDGAGRWKQTLHVTIPGMLSIIILKTTLSLGEVLHAGFEQIFNLYTPIVYETGDIIDTFVYRLGIEQAQYSASTAVGLFKSLISLILIGISYYLADKKAGYRIF